MLRRVFIFLFCLVSLGLQGTQAEAETLTVSLVDHLTNAKLANQSVSAYEKQADGSLIKRALATTDSAGVAKFDLDGLGSGRVYQIRAQPFLQPVSSGDISSAGSHVLKAGKLQVTLINGVNNTPYAWSEVGLIEKIADGSSVLRANFTTDGNGALKLDPAEFGSKTYLLRAASKADGSLKLSQEFSTPGAYSFKVGSTPLTVRLIDHVTNANLDSQPIEAHEKLADGSLVWRAMRTSDANGLVRFDLDGLDSGKTFVFKTKPFGYWVTSDELSNPGSFGFRVGRLQVQVIDGATGIGRSGQTVQVKRWAADGNHIGSMTAVTDAQGWIKVDPVDVGKVPFVFTAISPTDGREKVSSHIWLGSAQFILGTPALVAHLQDSVSAAPLSNLLVEVWEKLSDGTQSMRSTRRTDSSGVAKFDLDGLGSGRVYQIRAQPFLQPVSSGDISSAGSHVLKAGKLQVTLINGVNNTPYAWSEVGLIEKIADGSSVLRANFTTDGNGALKLDPAEFGSKTYLLRAASKADGSLKLSQEFSTPGAYSFKVGSAPLTVRLIDHVTNANLDSQPIEAHEKLADGSLVWRAMRTTDAAGQAKFDLDGLGSGKTFVFKTKPFGYWVTSDELSNPGSFGFRVGRLQVQVIDGATGIGRSGQTVQVKRWAADGNHIGSMTAVTDAQGWVKVDPVDVGKVPFVFTAISPTDGREKVSSHIWLGSAQFILGTPALVAHLQDSVSAAPLSNLLVEVWEKLSDGTQSMRSTRRTDSSGVAKFDLDGLGSGRVYQIRAQPFLQPVSSGDISSAGSHVLKAGKLQVTLINGVNNTPYAWSEVGLIEKIADGSSVLRANFTTDGNGALKLDPAEFGSKTYLLRAASKADGSLKLSQEFSTPGAYSFKVGSAPLTVRLIDHVTNANLDSQPIEAHEKLADGSLVWRAMRTTDAAGQAKFDLDGLGSGKTFVFKTKPFGYWVTSDELSNPGSFGFRVGRLQVQVIDGATGIGRSGQTVQVKRWAADGNHIGSMTAVTDAQGWIKVDPVDVGKVPFVFTAISPTDGREKVSSHIWLGSAQFILGTPALVAHLQDSVSAAPLSNLLVEVWEKLSDGTQSMRSTRRTDSSGVAKFDLDGLGSGRVYQIRAQPFLQPVSSGDISSAGSHVLKAGKLQVTLINGVNNTPYAWSEVGLIEKMADGSSVLRANFTTDGNGALKLDPADFGSKTYLLRAASKADGSLKLSQEFSTPGAYSFKVGNAPLTVRLIDHVTNANLDSQPIEAHEKLADGSLVWRAMRTSDANGLVRFDLDGLDSGKTFVLKAKPFGYWVSSSDLTSTGWLDFRVGTTLVTLSDGPSNTPLPGKNVVALEKLATGALRWHMQGTTDAAGQVKMDLPGLNNGAVYVLRVSNPYGQGQDYYSKLVQWKGTFAFTLVPDQTNAPDRTIPTVAITYPGPGAQVAPGGFRLNGSATDDVRLTSVSVILALPSGTTLELPATYYKDYQMWSVDTGALPDGVPGTLAVTVRAMDSSFNVAEARVDLTLANDTTAPVLTVTSHATGAKVPTGAFLVNGTLTDDSLGASLTARISGGGLASTETRAVEVAPGSGRWAVLVAPDTVFATAPISLTLTATDGAGNTTAKTLSLTPDDVFTQAWHVLQRTGFGGDPALLAEVAATGPTNYLLQQLAPGGVDDSAFQTRQTGWLDNGSYLGTEMLRYGLYSRKQLLEVMTWFWDNHFNSNYYKHAKPQYEQQENIAFRTHALGNFRNLLGISAKSPAMIYTLDGVSNFMGNPNENYARELLELHTLGVDGGYTQADVEEVARAFTGWSVRDGAFYYNAGQHDPGAKTMLGLNLPAGGGQSEGEQVLDLVARHASTAQFICTKLVTLFVSDQPVSGLVSRCASSFLANVDAPDQMAQVVWTILNSSEFLGNSYRGRKFKTPLELALGAAHQVGAESDGDDLALELPKMGMGLFINPRPTGYGETGDDWLSSGQLMDRVKFVDRLLATTPAAGAAPVDLLARVRAQGLETAEGVAGYLLTQALGPTANKSLGATALGVLNQTSTLPYLDAAPDTEARLRRTQKALMALPEYQYQ